MAKIIVVCLVLTALVAIAVSTPVGPSDIIFKTVKADSSAISKEHVRAKRACSFFDLGCMFGRKEDNGNAVTIGVGNNSKNIVDASHMVVSSQRA